MPIVKNITEKNTEEKLKNQVVGELFSSSVEFFESAISLFSSNSKFSIIHFAIALELMLKTKIAHHNLSQLLTKPDIFDLEKFKKGDFHSVSASNIVSRINTFSSKKINKIEESAYNDVFSHRNKIVHYFHIELNDNKSKNQILKKILRGWYFLNMRIMEWKDGEFLFNYSSSIYQLQRKMGALNDYSSSVFELVKDDLKHKEKNGAKILKCDVCSKRSSLEDKTYSPGIFFQEDVYLCAVCGSPKHKLFIQCTECTCRDEFFGIDGNTIRCSDCGFNIGDVLEFAPRIDWDMKMSRLICCPSCGADNVAIEGDNFYICLVCGNYGRNTNYCEWCNNEYFEFDPEYSFVEGCSRCCGQIGYRWDE